MKLLLLKMQLMICFAIVFCCIQSCKENKPSKDITTISKPAKMSSAVAVQMEELLKNCTDSAKKNDLQLFNPYSISSMFKPNFEPIFTNKMKFTEAGIALKNFIENDCRYYGLFSNAYHKLEIQQLHKQLTTDNASKTNVIQWAKAELLMADAFCQLAKHIKNGRLYADTNYKYHDTNLTTKVFMPLLNQFIKQPTGLDTLFKKIEPTIHDYDSLKLYLKTVLNQQENGEQQFTILVFPTKDSNKFVNAFVQRVKQEKTTINIPTSIDSIGLIQLIKDYQNLHGQSATGQFSKEMIASMNTNKQSKIVKIALALDKFRNIKIPNIGSYVIVNIPAFTLRGYNKNGVAVESKVAVGKLATKTPIMESEISDIIVMPKWFVPPSILKIPGYIARHRNNPNYIVTGNRVVQKSGPGNALGEMKFNFKSGEAIYLHDTNEKWAFSSNSRAVSHGCVRVQDYKNLASFISSLSPMVERNYKKAQDKMKVDTTSGDTTYTYKYVVKDSVVYNTDVIPNMAKHKNHHELTVQKKVPIYIKYYTCAIRNGVFVMYNDVYGYDKVLIEKYFSKYL